MKKEDWNSRLIKVISVAIIIALLTLTIQIFAKIDHIAITYIGYIIALLMIVIVLYKYIGAKNTLCSSCGFYGVMEVIKKEITDSYQTTKNDANTNSSRNSNDEINLTITKVHPNIINIREGIYHRQCKRCGNTDMKGFTIKK